MSTGHAKAGRRAAVSEWLAAVHEPNRMAVLLELTGGERTLTELAAAIGAAAVSVSQHLQRLRTAGLIDYTPRGVTRIYWLIWGTITPRTLELCHPAGVRDTLDRKALTAVMRGRCESGT